MIPILMNKNNSAITDKGDFVYITKFTSGIFCIHAYCIEYNDYRLNSICGKFEIKFRTFTEDGSYDSLNTFYIKNIGTFL